MENKEELQNKIAVTFHLINGKEITINFITFEGTLTTSLKWTRRLEKENNIISLNPDAIAMITYKTL